MKISPNPSTANRRPDAGLTRDTRDARVNRLDRLTRRDFVATAAASVAVLATGAVGAGPAAAAAAGGSGAEVAGPLVGTQLYGWGQYYDREGRRLDAHLGEALSAIRD